MVVTKKCTKNCTLILKKFFRDILKHKKLEPHINSESLGALIPEEDHKALEEQYLSYKEVMQNNSNF